MSGTGITQAKQAILYLIESLITHDVIKEKDITCMFFQSSCDVKKFADDPSLLWNNGNIKKYFDTIQAYGGIIFNLNNYMIVSKVYVTCNRCNN